MTIAERVAVAQGMLEMARKKADGWGPHFQLYQPPGQVEVLEWLIACSRAPLRVWDLSPADGEMASEHSFFVAASEQEARSEYRRLFGIEAETARAMPDDETLEIGFDDLPDDQDRLTKTCAEWATDENRGLLAEDF